MKIDRPGQEEMPAAIDQTSQLQLADAPAPNAVNKTALHYKEDLNTAEAKALAAEIEALKKELSRKGLKYSNFAGNFKDSDLGEDSQQRKTWEMVWLILHSKISNPADVLDIGGASTPFSFYLASKGHRVCVIDNDWGDNALVYNANYVAKKMNWQLRAIKQDAAGHFSFKDEAFDYIFCVCVMEHLSPQSRRSAMKEMQRVLKKGGKVAMTFDYSTTRNDAHTDKGLRFSDLAALN
ncbi:MAG: class I SAM-dependent methyltransferase, partial [Candidatus Omnitrophota bacterium]